MLGKVTGACTENWDKNNRRDNWSLALKTGYAIAGITSDHRYTFLKGRGITVNWIALLGDL